LSRILKSWPDVQNAWAHPGDAGENLKIHEFPTFHLLRLASLAKGAVAREYLEPWGLSVPEWRLLATVVLFSPIPFSEITSMTTMDKGQVSRTLRAAQSKGYVATELVPSERRPAEQGGSSISRVLVSITQVGRELHDKVMPMAQRYQLGLIELMNAEERRVMLDVLQRLYRHMESSARKT
jgi:DNA-binding MarR family transcriptional regulator